MIFWKKKNGSNNLFLSSYGCVYKAIRKSDGLVVAIKQVPIDEDIDDLRQEIEVIKSCESEFITAYYGTYYNGTSEIWV